MTSITEKLTKEQPNDREITRQSRIVLHGLLWEAAYEIEKLTDALEYMIGEFSHYVTQGDGDEHEEEALRFAIQAIQKIKGDKQ
jgi:hypothetical protein